MPISLEIKDSDLTGFTAQAIDQVQGDVDEYIIKLLKEIDHIEQIRRPPGTSDREITATIVQDATQLLKRVPAKSSPLSVKLIRIFSALFSLVAGMMYDNAQIQQNQIYLFWFLLVMVFTITFTMLAVIKE